MSAVSEMSIFAEPRDDAAPMLATKRGEVTQRAFMNAVADFGAALPDAPRAMNVCVDRGAFMVAFCAVLARGGTNLLPPDTLPPTLARIREQWPGALAVVDHVGSEARNVDAAILCDIAALLRAAPSVRAASPASGYTVDRNGAVARSVSELIAYEHVAAVPFTSGSTGAPRPQPKCWGAMHFVAAATNARFFVDMPRYAIVATVPSQHMYGLETTLMLALQGRALVATERPLLPTDIARVLQRMPAPRILVTTPVHLRALVRSGQALPELALVLSATAPLSTALAALTEARCQCEVHEIYGCTEAGALASRRTVSGDVWQLFDGITIAAVLGDDEGLVDGPHLASPVALPDRIARVSAQRFRLLGRRGDLVNVAGKRASLAELNQKLLEVPGVLDGVIFVPEGGVDEIGRLRGMVVTDGRSEQEVLRQLALSIDAVFLPRPLKKVESIARNATGKIQHAVLSDASRVDD